MWRYRKIFKLKFVNKRDLITSLVLYGLFVYFIVITIISYQKIGKTTEESIAEFVLYFSMNILSFILSLIGMFFVLLFSILDIYFHVKYSYVIEAIKIKMILFIICTLFLLCVLVKEFILLNLILFIVFLILSILLVRMVKLVDTSDLESDS